MHGLSREEKAALGTYAAVLHDVPAVEFYTQGGGACAVHAAFGDGPVEDAIGHANPRGFLQAAFCRPLSVFRTSLGVRGPGHFRLSMLLMKV